MVGGRHANNDVYDCLEHSFFLVSVLVSVTCGLVVTEAAHCRVSSVTFHSLQASRTGSF